MNKTIKVFSPASVANIGPGFDVLGFAVQKLGDIIIATKTKSGVTISNIDSKTKLSYESDKNTVGIAAKAVLKMIKCEGGIDFKIKKGLPCGSGLGSSAASAAAGAFAANYLYENKLTKNELVIAATSAEEIVSGGFFANNTAPSLLGGATLTGIDNPLQITKVGTLSKLIVILVTPKIVVLTKDARAILPKDVPMKSFISNMSNACAITAAFAKNDYTLFSGCLNDIIIEPARKSLIKGFDEVKKAAILAGADGMTISGSGPTVFAITDSNKKAEKIKSAMIAAFRKAGVESEGIVTKIDEKGTRIVR